MEEACCLKSHMFMKKRTVLWKEGVLFFCERNAGVQVEHLLLQENLFHSGIELFPDSPVPGFGGKIDGKLRRVLIGLSGMEGTGVGIAQDMAFLFCQEVGIFLQGMGYAFFEFFRRRHFVFKGNGRLLHIGLVNV